MGQSPVLSIVSMYRAQYGVHGTSPYPEFEAPLNIPSAARLCTPILTEYQTSASPLVIPDQAWHIWAYEDILPLRFTKPTQVGPNSTQRVPT